MIKVRCDEIGNCPLADGQVHEMESIDAHPCLLRGEVGRCGLKEVEGPRWPPEVPPKVWLAALIAAGILLIAGLAWSFIPRTPSCKVADVRSLMALDPKVGELEEAGLDCLESGKARAEADHLVVGIAALRLADNKGSAAAALQLGRLFDPTSRKEIEEESKEPGLLPAPDPALALQFYDRAAKRGDSEAAKAAAGLRAQSAMPPASGTQVGRGGAPINVPGYADIYQRVLAKPGAELMDAPGAGAGRPVEPLEIFYVFATRPGWLQVGRALERRAEGWIAEDKAQPFNAMLVMHYLGAGGRNPVLFFNDEMAAKALLMQPGASDAVAELVKSAKSGSPDPRLVAIEDQSVNWAASPYVMPILKAVQTTTDDGRSIYLANVASVSGLGGRSVQSECGESSVRELRHQIVFVIDTTASMGPYIQGVRRIANAWRSEIERRGLTDRFRFGVVAYRNNMDGPEQAGLEYVKDTALPLSTTSDAAAFTDAMAKLSAARVSTHSFDEDAVAGLQEGLEYGWSGSCGARLMILVTDAGALQSDDPKAHYPGVGLSTIAARAADRNIRIFTVHVATPEARQARNIDKAAGQYREAFANPQSPTGGYDVIANGSPQSFTNYIGRIGSIINVADRVGLLSAPNIVAGREPTVEEKILTELFSVQQRFLGTAAKAQAPTFTDSWTSDRDLANPDRRALEIKVLLTRRQLNQLADQTERLVRTARQAKLDTTRFFALLRMVSAATAQDPQRFGDQVTRLGGMMPSFLKLLPYKSDVLSLTAEDWRGMGPSKQDAFLRRLNEKFEYYRAVNNNQEMWRPGNGDAPDEQFTHIPLSQMP